MTRVYDLLLAGIGVSLALALVAQSGILPVGIAPLSAVLAAVLVGYALFGTPVANLAQNADERRSAHRQQLGRGP